MGSIRPARRFDARRALADRDLPNRIAPDGGPPCAFALLQRSIATPPHRPAGPKTDPSDDASSPGLSCRATRAGTADPRSAGPPGPAACRVRGLSTPSAASTTVPPDALRRRSVHRLHPPRPSPRVDRAASRRPLPSWRCSRRFASPPRGACGRGRLQGFDPGANSYGPPDPEGPGASLPSWASPSRALTPSGLGPRFGSRSLPSHALGGLTSCPTCVPGSCGTEGSVGPSRGYRLSWGSSPCDRRGHVPAGARGGHMASPHGSRALQAARTDLCPVAIRPGRRRSADPSSAVHR
jgi:hypothetical protein